MRKKGLGLCVFLLAACCCLGGVASRAAAAPREARAIKIAVGSSYAPFYFHGADGKPKGWLVDLWRLWAEKSGRKIQFVEAPFADTLLMVRNGRADVHGGLFFSPSRAGFLDFLTPLVKVETAIFFHRDLYGITGLNDLRGVVVGVVKGDYAHEFLRDNHPELRLEVFAGNRELFEAAKKGHLKSFLVDTPVAIYFLKQYHLLDSFSYLPHHPVYSNKMIAAVKKGNKAMAALVRKGFAKIGPPQLAGIADRWGENGRKGQAGVLTIAARRNNAPFSWLSNSGGPAGILVDLWRMWSAKTGKRVDFAMGNRAEIERYMATGQAKVEAGVLRDWQADERLNFSLPLFPVEVNLFHRGRNDALDLKDLAGKRVGFVYGAGYAELAGDKLPGAHLAPYDRLEPMLADLAKGELDGVVHAGIAVENALRLLGLSGRIKRRPEPLAVRNLYAGVPKKDPETLNLVNQGLAMIPQADIAAIERYWVPDPQLRRYRKLITRFHLGPKEKAWLAGHKNIRLGIARDYLPFEGMSPRGNYRGMASEYVQLLNRKLGVSMKPLAGLSREEMTAATAANKVDVIACISPTPGWAAKFSFTRPYMVVPNVVVTREDHPMIAGLAGLGKARVAVVKGQAIEEYIKKHHPALQIVPVAGVSAGLEAVAEKGAEAFVDTLPTITYYLRKTGRKGLKVAATTKAEYRFAFAVRKDWPELANVLEKALQSIGEKERERIANRWSNVQFSRETDWNFVLRTGVGAAALLGLILAVIIAWNRRLAREVEQRRQAEKEMRDSQDRLESIASNMPGVVYRQVLGGDGSLGYTYVSGAVQSLYGLSPQRVRSHPEECLEAVHPEDRQRFRESLIGSAADSRPWAMEFRIVAVDGGVKWMRGAAKTHKTENGDTVWDGLLLDITDERLAEERFQNLAANVPGALVQIKVSSEGDWEYRFLSPKCVEFFGQPPEVVIRERLRLPWHPEDTERVNRELAQARRGRGHMNLVGRTVRPDGEVRWTRLYASPVQREDGGLIYNGFLLDITERKQAEQEYLASERKIKAMSQAVDDALIMIDSQGKVLFWNPAAERLFGFSESEALGMDFHSMAATEQDRHKAIAGLAHFAASGQGPVVGVTTQIQATNRDGRLFPVEVTLSAFQLEGQWYAVGTVRDISERKRAEEDLRKSREDFRVIADYTFDWEAWHDATGRLLWVNPAVERITGYDVAECMAMPDYPLPLIHPEDREVWRQCLARALAGEVGDDTPCRVLAKNGQVHWVGLSWNPVFNDQGRYTGFRISQRDFTERKRADDEIKRTTERYTKLIHAMPDAVTQTDLDGTITYISPRVLKVYGINDPKKAMGRNCMDWVHPSHRAQAREDLFSILKPDADSDSMPMEYLMFRQDGSTFWGSLNTAVLRDADGRPGGMLIVTRDITERKRAEKEIGESRQRLDLALEGGNLGTWDSDFLSNRTVVDERWAKLMRLDLADLEDPFLAWINSIHPDDVAQVREMGRKYRLGEIEQYQARYRVILAGGEERWQVSRGKAVGRDDRGRVTRMVGTVMDITEQQKAEDALKESEEKSRLILDSAGEGIFGVDREGRITFINPTALSLLDHGENELLGQPVHEAIHHSFEDGRPYPVDECPMTASYQRGEERQVTDEVLWRKDGACFPVEYSSKPILKDGDVMGAVITFRDVTQRRISEQLLTESQNRLDLALTASNTGMWDWRPQTGEDFHSEQWYRQLGYEPKEFPPEIKTLTELMHPEDRAGFELVAQGYASHGEDEYKQEFRMKARDGSWKWILSLGRVTERDDRGRPARVVGVHLDMTEQKLNEQRLAASRQRLSQIINFLPDPTWVIDGQGRVVAWNRAVAELTGIGEQEMLGKGDNEYAIPFYGERRPVLIDLVGRDPAEMQDAYLYLERKGEGVLVAESFHPALNGGAYLAAAARALYGPDGELEGAIETVRDVTDRKKVEQEMQNYVEDLERFNRLVVGREEKMIELKEEINGLLAELGQQHKYKIVH